MIDAAGRKTYSRERLWATVPFRSARDPLLLRLGARTMLRQWSGSAVLSGTLRALLLAALCVPLAAAAPSETRSGTAARPSGKTKPLVPEKLLRAFRGNREDARHRALDDVERWHLADRQLPDTLWKVIDPELKANPL